MIKEMACIVCPMSCRLQVTLNDNNEVESVTGNTCPRGEKYARNEMSNPMRMLTSTVKLEKGLYSRLPVILSGEIPKGNMFEVMKELESIIIYAPVKINDIIIENVCGLSVNVIASRSVKRDDGKQ